MGYIEKPQWLVEVFFVCFPSGWGVLNFLFRRCNLCLEEVLVLPSIFSCQFTDKCQFAGIH